LSRMKWGNEGGRGYGTSGSVGRGKAKRKTPKSGTPRGLRKAAKAYNAAAKKRREAIMGRAKAVGVGLSPHARPLPAVVAERPERGESAVWPRAAKRRRKAARKVSAPSGSRKVISVSGTERDAANPTGRAPFKSRVDGRSSKGRRARYVGTYGARKPGGQFAGPGWWREQP
jgi:hypothetical protein